MKRVKIVGRVMAAIKVIAIAAIVGLAAAPLAKADTWRGTAPFCDGQCLPGETQIATSKSGDGATCWTGHKVLCRSASAICQPKPITATCVFVVLICNNGCSTFACSVCFGFGNW